jgi:ATP-dependent helicase/nuclease subunit A
MAGKPQWTKQQLAAITDRNHDVLVTASAGTGKTAVLSGRVVEIISDSSNCPDVRSIVVMTFTEAAASEMKARISAALKDKYLAGRDPHLRKQLLLIEAADISTIHSFCKRLITEFFFKLGIDPSFRILPEDEQRLIKADILEQVIKQAHEDPQIQNCLVELLYSRPLQGSASFLNNIVAVHDFLDSISSRQNWYRQADMLCSTPDPAKGPLGEKQKLILIKKLNTCLDQLLHSVKLDSKLADGHWSDQIQSDMIAPVQECIKFVNKSDFVACGEVIKNYVKAKWNNRPKGMQEEIAETIKAPANKAIEVFRSLSELAIINPRYLEIVCSKANLQTKILIELVKRFENQYRKTKRQLNCLDFADLEHHALELLTKPGTDEPSGIAMELRKRFRYIFVDEYQDVNWVQQSVLSRLSTGDNVFVVGDVKQSIYAWRQAQPKIFIDRLDNASPDAADAINGLRVDLTGNFRSRKGVLDFANTVFSRIMTRSFADIDYDETAMLEAKADYKPLEQVYNSRPVKSAVELNLLCDDDQDDQKEDSASCDSDDLDLTTAEQRQAAFVANRIKQMVELREFEILDRKTKAYRPVDYRDIVILMRGVSKKSNDYADILRLHDVPVSSQNTSGYFESTEITDFISLLCVLDNPQRDIELAAVLRSPIFNVSDGELLKVRYFTDKAGLQ